MIAQRHSLPNAGAAAEACARRVTGLLETALEGGEIASFAVSGGSTPRLLFEKLVTLRFDWSRVHLFWVDERCVPPSDPASNYRLAKDWLIPRRANSGTQRSSNRRGDRAKRSRPSLRRADPPVFESGAGRDAAFRRGAVWNGCGCSYGQPVPGRAAPRRSRGHCGGRVRATIPPVAGHLAAGAAARSTPCGLPGAGADKAEAVRAVFQAPLEPKKYPSQLIDRGAEWFLDKPRQP